MSDRSSVSTTKGVFGGRSAAIDVARAGVVDADYVVIDAADLSPHRASGQKQMHANPSPPGVLSPSGMDMLRRRKWRRSPKASQSGGPLFWSAGAALAAVAFWVAGGHAVILPLVADATEPASGMRIASVISRVDRSGLRPVLQIDGQAVNEGDATMAMPPLNIEVLSPAGGSMHYRLGTSGLPVERGASFAFSSRLDMPKDGVQTVFVTFAD